MSTLAELHERWSQDPEYRGHAGPDSPAKPHMLACRRWRHHPQRDHLRLIETELHQRTHMVVPLLTIRHRGSRTEWRGFQRLGFDAASSPARSTAITAPLSPAPRKAPCRRRRRLRIRVALPLVHRRSPGPPGRAPPGRRRSPAGGAPSPAGPGAAPAASTAGPPTRPGRCASARPPPATDAPRTGGPRRPPRLRGSPCDDCRRYQQGGCVHPEAMRPRRRRRR